MHSVFISPQVYVCAFLLSPFPFLLFFLSLSGGRTNILRAELPWRCTPPSQRPNRGFSPIGSMVLHHTPTNAHILALACRAAWTSAVKRAHTHTHTPACLHTHNDWLFFTYLMFQPMVYFHSLARELSPECLQWENSFRWSGSDRGTSNEHSYVSE